MHYTYALMSLKNKRVYIGRTDNLRRRVFEHNSGIGGKYTRDSRPFKLVFYEAFFSKEDAVRQELFYKSGYGKEILKEKISHSLGLASHSLPEKNS